MFVFVFTLLHACWLKLTIRQGMSLSKQSPFLFLPSVCLFSYFLYSLLVNCPMRWAKSEDLAVYLDEQITGEA